MMGPADTVGKAGDHPDRSRADHEGTAWLIRLQDDPDDHAIRAQFETWLNSSATNMVAWAEIEHLSRVVRAAGHSRKAQDDLDSGGEVLSFERARARHSTKRTLRGRVLQPSAVAAAACIALAAGPNLLVQVRADEMAGIGAPKSVHLADGSVVRLAPGGAMSVDFADGERKVNLLRGEAYFDVAHDAARPFRIAAAGTTTTVLGTAFDVRRKKDGVAVSVRRGRVRVGCDDRPTAAFLSVGQAADIVCGREVLRSTVAPNHVAPWMNGQMIAADRPMRDVIGALRPWYRGIIIARGEGIDRLRVTGVYNLRDPQRALEALAAPHHATVLKITPWVMVISAD